MIDENIVNKKRVLYKKFWIPLKSKTACRRLSIIVKHIKIYKLAVKKSSSFALNCLKSRLWHLKFLGQKVIKPYIKIIYSLLIESVDWQGFLFCVITMHICHRKLTRIIFSNMANIMKNNKKKYWVNFVFFKYTVQVKFTAYFSNEMLFGAFSLIVV